MGKLTDPHVRGALSKKHDKKLVLGDGDGLTLVCIGRSCTWQLRYMLDGRARTLGLGSAKLISLAEARTKALSERKAVRVDRVDVVEHHGPRAQRKAKEAEREAEAGKESPQTFRQAADLYMQLKRSGMSETHAHDFEASLKKWAHPRIGDLTVAQITVDDVTGVLLQDVGGEPLWTARHVTASNVRQRIDVVIGAAIAAGKRTDANPAVWSTLKHLLPKSSDVHAKKHRPHLPPADAASFMVQLRATDTIFARALELTILTAVRAGSTRDATWSEFDLDGATWTIPSVKAKGKKPVAFRVALSDAAVSLLRELPGANERNPSAYVFPGLMKGQPMSRGAQLECLNKLAPGMTVHGFRGTFRTWAEKSGVAFNIAEAALAHAERSAVVRAYQHDDLLEERRPVMQGWADFLAAAPAAQASAAEAA